MSDPGPHARASYRRFAAGAASWFLGWSIQSVVFTWLVIGTMQAPAAILGTVQTALTLPGPLIALAGGTLADRVDRRRMLIGIHAGMCLLSIALALATWSGRLSLPVLLGYAVCAGSLHGAALPTRSAFLGDVAGVDLMRAVTLLTVVQSTAQVVGPLTGASAAWLGATAGLVLQGVVFCAGGVALHSIRVPSGSVCRASAGRSEVPWHGFRVTMRSPVLRSLVIAATGHAFGYVGPLYVLLPLLVRDVYGGGAGGLGLVAALFPAGIVLGSLLSLRRAAPRRARGRAMLLGLGAAGGVIAALALAPSRTEFYLAVLAWGGAASVFFNTNRTLVQETAEADVRGRALALQTIGPMLAGPASTLFAGLLCQATGLVGACLVFGSVMIAIALALWPAAAPR